MPKLLVAAALALVSSSGAAVGQPVPAQTDRAAGIDMAMLHLQVILDHLGFSPGVLDGRPGMSTTAALKGFQQSRGLAQTGTLDAPTCPSEAGSLAPGAQVTCTTVYNVTQADVDSGSVTNTATAVGTPSGADAPVASSPSTATVMEPAAAALSLVKSANVTSVTKAGQVVTFSFTVTNTGNTTLSHPSVEEGTFNGHGKLPAPTCPADAAELIPGQVEICHADYTVMAADLTGIPLSNTATARATTMDGDPVESAASTATVADVPPATAPTALAETGSTVHWGYGLLALLLVGIGAAALLIRRRRNA